MTLFKNYLKTAFRNAIKHKGHTCINIAGLSVGLAACLLLLLWIQFELSYDRFHKNAERIYRVTFQYTADGKTKIRAKTSAPLGPALVNDFPDILKSARFRKNRFLVRFGEKLFYEDIFFTDPEMFDIFTLPFTKGSPANALTAPNSIIISEKARAKYFRDENPIGKTIKLYEDRPLKITAVFKDIPENSHFHFDFLGRFADIGEKKMQNWGKGNFYTYVLTTEKFSSDEFNLKSTQIVDKYRGKQLRKKYSLRYSV
ncbi:MAG: ABC transporter permease [bacterium]|nr:ABC transporter permease [bacterium]